ncbi:MAG: C4-dicarboxylate ABC transporter [Desulfobulbaceae bacterium BRH_c16a]|nr:MAG: C4-dicarboxylate ABC transporter [Desulfobulbaceae bacterium BRH_c16a]
MTTATIFLIDDEESVRVSVSQWLSLADYRVACFGDAGSALHGIDTGFEGVVVSDIRMPGMDGFELLQAVRQRDPEIPVVLFTGHGDIPMAVSAMRAGAYDFIEKPFDPEILLETIRRAGEKRGLIMENRRLKEELQKVSGIDSQLLGNSQAIQMVHREIADLGPTDASVFLVGETGCGKEVVARCLHQVSHRRNGPFIAINCGAIPESLFESELFGHEAGAFTGAQARRIGKFEQAGGGTLFLDEVTSMPINLQVKVLRVLQEREIERLGGTGPLPIDIRVISAGNKDPRKACSGGLFREDLYYRLNLAEIHIPPLRLRGPDILLLFEYFALRAAEKYRRKAPPLAGEAITTLMAYGWPGNVRELKNTAERYVLSSLPEEGRIASILQHSQTPMACGHDATLADQTGLFERCVLERSLHRHKGNILAVMKELDLPRRTLNQKMLSHGLARNDFLEGRT